MDNLEEICKNVVKSAEITRSKQNECDGAISKFKSLLEDMIDRKFIFSYDLLKIPVEKRKDETHTNCIKFAFKLFETLELRHDEEFLN